MPDGPQVDRTLDLTDPTVPWCPLAVDVPWPIDERLQRLVDLVADEKLGPTSKREVAAALIQTAEESGLAIWDRVLRFRRAKVGDAAFWMPADEAIISFSARTPGRKPRR